jgi:hypothetical protein
MLAQITKNYRPQLNIFESQLNLIQSLSSKEHFSAQQEPIEFDPKVLYYFYLS